jgi:hypothetical protein
MAHFLTRVGDRVTCPAGAGVVCGGHRRYVASLGAHVDYVSVRLDASPRRIVTYRAADVSWVPDGWPRDAEGGAMAYADMSPDQRQAACRAATSHKGE